MSTAAAATELAKTYDPAAVEAEAYRVWLDEKCFEADPSKPGEPYSIVIPPPNVTGALHLGHAINNTLQDILVRQHRMAGFNTVWIPGIDHAGIATQAVVEKQLKEKENKTRHDVGRDGLVERIWAWKQQYGDRILMQLQRLGCSCDWSRTRFTLDEQCARAVRETFFKLFRDGLVYRGKRLVNWDTHLLTSISDDELYTEPTKTSMWHIRYPIEDATPSPGTPGEGGGEGLRPANDANQSSGVDPHPNPLPAYRERGPEEARPTFMTVATTRPETMLADTAVAVHPDDPRWNWAVGKRVRLPLTGRLIPIIADPILVDMAFGSGVVKVTPAHDPNDYAVYARHKGTATEIAILNLMTPDGRVNDAEPSWSAYAGLTFAAARKRIVEDLAAGGFHNPETDVKPHEANVSFSDRSKTAIQPYLSDQWFVKMAPLAEPALEVVRDGTIQFFPERHAQQYLSWLGEKRDWPISRQLWWGHRIPVWHLQWFAVPPEDLSGNSEELNNSMLPQQIAAVDEFATLFGVAGEITTHGSASTGELWASAQTAAAEAALNKLAAASDKWKQGARRWEEFSDGVQTEEQSRLLYNHASAQFSRVFQDPDVLDTWFSSALWPHSTLGWPERTADLAKWYPTAVLMTGRDIITLWVARMVMMGMYNMGGRQSAERKVQSAERKVQSAERRAQSAEGQENGDDGLSSALCAERSALPSGIPFAHVAINPTILDGKGERMSKSKGNGVDPVDIIDTHGADALRFTMTTMATETQDVRLPVRKLPDGRNTSDRFDVGRNFCTKLWNAARFALANLAGTGIVASATMAPPEGQSPSLADRWIVSRFARTLDEANTALASYRFDQYARACYDFFWRDFCDWYVEASKPAMRDPARSAQTAAVLAAVLDGLLRLLHPMVPFITETIWWKLDEVRPSRGLPNLACPPSRRLVAAAWPTAGDPDEEAERVFAKLQTLIAAVRTVRSDYKVDPRKPVGVQFSVGGDARRQIDANRELIELLAVCTVDRVDADLPLPANAARATADGVDLYVLDLIDPAAEEQRVAKQRDELARKAAALKGRLANPSYADKAPAHLVQQTRDELAAVEAELAKAGS